MELGDAASEIPTGADYTHSLLDTQAASGGPEVNVRGIGLSDLERCLRFELMLPGETFGQTLKSPQWDAAGLSDAMLRQEATMCVLWYGTDQNPDSTQLNQSIEASEEDAAEHATRILPGMSFDDRFMIRTVVRGYDAIAWSPVEASRAPASGDAPARLGVSVKYAGVVWNEGSMLYTIFSSELDRDELVKMAESLHPAEFR